MGFSLKKTFRKVGRVAAGVATLGLSETKPARQAARWVDPSTKEGRKHGLIVGVAAAGVAATVLTAGAAAPAGAGAIAAVTAGGVAALKAGSSIAAVDAAEQAERAEKRQAETAAATTAEQATATATAKDPGDAPPTFGEWLRSLLGGRP